MTTHPDLTTAAAYMDEAMKAIALAKQTLLGGAGGALFLSTPALAEAEASPGNPYGSSVPLASLRDREHYDAGSAAEGVPGWDDPLPGEVAEGVEPTCGAVDSQAAEHGISFVCDLAPGHDGHHFDHLGGGDSYASWPPSLCPAQWGEPPETMLCSLASGHDGNHATAEGIEWGGRWETAEPGRCGTADHPGACEDPWQETAEPHGGAR